MNSSVIVFPGSNCDRDIAVALEKLQFKNKIDDMCKKLLVNLIIEDFDISKI